MPEHGPVGDPDGEPPGYKSRGGHFNQIFPFGNPGENRPCVPNSLLFEDQAAVTLGQPNRTDKTFPGVEEMVLTSNGHVSEPVPIPLGLGGGRRVGRDAGRGGGSGLGGVGGLRRGGGGLAVVMPGDRAKPECGGPRAATFKGT